MPLYCFYCCLSSTFMALPGDLRLDGVRGYGGCLEFKRAQGGTIPLPLTDWGARLLPGQHHTRRPTPSAGQPFCHRTSVRSGSRADSAWSPAAAGEIPLYEAASFDIGRG
jgi:hypothetical protein